MVSNAHARVLYSVDLAKRASAEAGELAGDKIRKFGNDVYLNRAWYSFLLAFLVAAGVGSFPDSS